MVFFGTDFLCKARCNVVGGNIQYKDGQRREQSRDLSKGFPRPKRTKISKDAAITPVVQTKKRREKKRKGVKHDKRKERLIIQSWEGERDKIILATCCS